MKATDIPPAGEHHPCVQSEPGTPHARRPTELLGPRLGWWCPTCRRQRERATKAQTRSATVSRTYGLSPDDVDAVRATMPQNSAGARVCPGCQRATGAAKALATAHDHRLERQGLPMRETVRGFLCGPCNQTIGRYSAEALLRLAQYKIDPPAFDALGTHQDEPRFRLEARIVPKAGYG